MCISVVLGTTGLVGAQTRKKTVTALVIWWLLVCKAYNKRYAGDSACLRGINPFSTAYFDNIHVHFCCSRHNRFGWGSNKKKKQSQLWLFGGFSSARPITSGMREIVHVCGLLYALYALCILTHIHTHSLFKHARYIIYMHTFCMHAYYIYIHTYARTLCTYALTQYTYIYTHAICAICAMHTHTHTHAFSI